MNVKELAESRIGKYVQWNNGYRLFVVGKNPKYPDEFIVRDPKTNREWGSVASNITEAIEITEEKAIEEYCAIEIDVPQFSLGCCGQWRVGQPNISLNFDLQQGEISLNDSYRIQNLIDTFFKSHEISARVFRKDNGIEIEFISMKSIKKNSCCEHEIDK